MAVNRVGLIGYPVKHSVSPAMHNAAFKALGMQNEWLYDAMAIPPDIVRYAVLEPKRHGYIGLNITVPFKRTALEFVIPDDKARAIGAVNTIDFRDDTGTNTDVDGFIGDLDAHHIEVNNKRVIVLGAGGAARAAIYGLWQSGADVIVCNRTPEHAKQLLKEFKSATGENLGQYMTQANAAQSEATLIINTTSAGMSPNIDISAWDDEIPLPDRIIGYDMVYNPESTKFMQQIENVGGQSFNGLGMLVRQGAIAFKLWTGVEPPLDVMMRAAKSELLKLSKNEE